VRAIVIGDVVGGVGHSAVLDALPGLLDEHGADLVVVNAENAASGAGTSPRQARDLLDAGAHVVTGGNHTFRRREILPLLGSDPRVLRPQNLVVTGPGSGFARVESVEGEAVVINLLGAVFMEAAMSPFALIDDLLERASGARYVLVDIHAEATSEKIALARYLDGRVTAVFGTHTHVQTADAKILPGGTAYISDLGMSGPHDSVIGVDTQVVINRFLRGLPGRFEVAEGDVRVQGAVIDADDSGRATAIAPFDLEISP
jgi:metallophosphoesterase (TIGR00282 family)